MLNREYKREEKTMKDSNKLSEQILLELLLYFCIKGEETEKLNTIDFIEEIKQVLSSINTNK
jgi:hypothetical protein